MNLKKKDIYIISSMFKVDCSMLNDQCSMFNDKRYFSFTSKIVFITPDNTIIAVKTPIFKVNKTTCVVSIL